MKTQLFRWGCLILIAALFLSFDLILFFAFTRRCLPDEAASVRAKSVGLDRYLPFDPASDVAVGASSLKLSGDLPVLDGAAALYPVFSAFVNAVYPKESVVFDGTDFAPESKLQMRNTRSAYRAIVDGDADLIFCAGPSSEQAAYAAQKGVELEFVPIGREAFVFIVNGDNPVDGLTVEQIRGIYSGKYTKWSQVGGDETLIDPLQRNVGSGSQTTMLAFMGDVPMKRNPFGIFGRSIGYSFRYYVEGIMEKQRVKMLAINGVYPDAESIADGSYPLTDTFYAVYRKGDENPDLTLLLDWIRSPEGQELIAKSGYVPLAAEEIG